MKLLRSRSPSLLQHLGQSLRAIAWIASGLTAFTAFGSGYGLPIEAHFDPVDGTFPLVVDGAPASLLVAPGEDVAVTRALQDFREDVARVSGHAPEILDGAVRGPVVLVGTLGDSPLVEKLVADNAIDVSELTGRWEGFLLDVVEHPFPGVDSALVVVGSDRRGTIYGLYTLSEAIGVSPWYWWADMPVERRETIFIDTRGGVIDAPAVRYRGIFLNDEAPSLTNWAREKFGGFNHHFYEHVFELILRLRGNFIWPAMWDSAFYDDDPLNGPTAQNYGIVLSTSHHEPMARAHSEWRRYGEGPWNYETNGETLREFWRTAVRDRKQFEHVYTLAMRGDGDEAMSEETNTALLERIVRDQRRILAEEIDRPLETIPQVWALYKEVQSYYENGMRVPDDVTLLWCDDNWGNIRRLPTPDERGRAGGAGVYYHFDYVGGPRNYKWINVQPLTKVWEQMNLAWEYDAHRIWIVNVGDLKPMELPIDFFLTMAWNPPAMRYDDLTPFTEAFAAQAFGAKFAEEAASLLNGYVKLNRRRTPEMLNPEVLSLVHYNEADRVLGEWEDLSRRAAVVAEQLPEKARSAYFQLVTYPIEACGNLWKLHVAAGRNALYTRQGRVDANAQANLVEAAFARDAALEEAYHALNDGKWNHFMDQIRLGYSFWQQPRAASTPPLSRVRPVDGASPALAIEGSTLARPIWGAEPPVLPTLDVFSRRSTWLELFNAGDTAYTFTAQPGASWLHVSPLEGTVETTTRLTVSVDWTNAPLDLDASTITLRTSAGVSFEVTVPLFNPSSPRPDAVRGFVETNGAIAIDAPHFDAAVAGGEYGIQPLPDFGLTVGGVMFLPVTAAPIESPGVDSPHIAYRLHTFTEGTAEVEFHLAPSLDFQPGAGLRFAVSVDDGEPRVLPVGTWKTLQTWEKAVGDGVRRVTTTLDFGAPGSHILKFWMVTPGVVLERMVIDFGGLEPSYLGPPESPRFP